MESDHSLSPDAQKTPSPTPQQPQQPQPSDCTTTCHNCGGPATLTPPPCFPSLSPPPSYIPIRYPAVNLPPSSPSQQQAIILSPVPHAQKVPAVSLFTHHFQTPVKQIHSQSDIERFQNSESVANFLGFIVALCESIRGRKISDPCHQSQTLLSIVSVLEALIQWVDEIPPVQQSARYGNLSYRVWHERLEEQSEALMRRVLESDDECDYSPAIIELVPYFMDSYGNASRIDYGTGHETNFGAWLYCLARLGLLKEEDHQGVVSRVFVKYLELMRKLQLVYCLEPAGSHGVWGLDDYHFLPFIFGSSQLIDHKYMKPKSIHNEDILDNFSNEYMYLSCIQFVKKVKKGLFAEHSPLLDDISGVPNWNKVNSGLLKMYRVEVLGKVPIMQHFLFGSLIKW
ncbi:Phosphotyrosyl phosphatase activator, PTPA [Dillenia turbinata]|uniref:Serine/threonine-protein phosphatase 2A activator n=1 Tax=Dillenia turbinata TaxID=194707 RepID=A0AAN8YTZ6_9MAGN